MTTRKRALFNGMPRSVAIGDHAELLHALQPLERCLSTDAKPIGEALRRRRAHLVEQRHYLALAVREAWRVTELPATVFALEQELVFVSLPVACLHVERELGTAAA